MFYQNYKNTIKRIIRSPLIWMILVIATTFTIWQACEVMYATIYGTDQQANYVLYYHKYLQMIVNLEWKLMHYIIPCLAVIISMVAINGDYSDNFYEIERSRGVKTTAYFFGRLTAIITVNLLVAILFALLSVNIYFFTRGGTSNFAAFATPNPHNNIIWNLGDYIKHSTISSIRLVLTCQFPMILLCIGLTYMFGTILKSGMLAGIGGSSFVLIAYLADQKYRWAFNMILYKYFLPTKIGSYMYFMFYDTQFNSPQHISADGINHYMPDSLEDTLIWLAILIGTSLLVLAVSYLCTKKRKI